MVSSTKLRNKLFSVYSENLSLYRPELQNKFLCPMCQKDFSRDALQPDELALSLAHVVPKSLGGKLKTLACSSCDNEFGHKYDIHLARERKHFEEIKQNKSTKYCYFKPDGCERILTMIDYEGMRGPNPHLNIFNPPKMPPEVWRRYFERIDYPAGEFKFSLIFEEPMLKLKERNLSLIYSAFLMMFYQFGYEYILSESADFLRQAIYGRVESFDFRNAILFCKGGPVNDGPTFATVKISESSCFMASFIPFYEESIFIVLLPGLGDEIGQYANLLNGKYEYEYVNIKLIPHNILPDLLSNPGAKDIGKTLYRKIKEIP
jgi:hypothetical protein